MRRPAHAHLGASGYAAEVTEAGEQLRPWLRTPLMREVIAGVSIAAMGVPQGVAYALIAGLPPVMGLYAGMLPAVVSAVLRSSRHVVVGPTNALSLLFATSIAATMPDPVDAAATLALLTGAVQVLGGALRLKALVDYVSTTVVTGYITGAAALIIVGQLPVLTGTPRGGDNIVEALVTWISGLGRTDYVSVLLGIGTAHFIVWARRRLPKGSSELLAMAGSLLVAWVMALDVATVADLGTIPASLPTPVMPSMEGWTLLLPVAGAAAVLSMVEATSVGRAIASRSGQRLDMTWEFIGQGFGNVASAFTGGYPVSGSLSRSVLNERVGGGRWASALSGVLAMLAVLLAAPALDRIPLASLAGLLVVVAVDLVEPARIRRILASGLSDRLAYVATVLGTWFLPLDNAIYLGVGISVVLFLRRARHLYVTELRFDRKGRLRECEPTEPASESLRVCGAVRVLNIEGPLFFGAANELDQVLSDAADKPVPAAEAGTGARPQTLIVRLKRAHDLDYTAAVVLGSAYRRLAGEGRELVLVGVRSDMLQRMEEVGLVDVLGIDHIYPTRRGGVWATAIR